MERLREPPLVTADFEGFVAEARLARLNASLAERPFRGVVVACPWVPDLLDAARRARLDSADAFGAWIVGGLVPALGRRADLALDGAVGIDGVSLGGRAALLVGLAHPAAFRAVGSLQAAVQASEARELARRAATALRSAGRPLPLRLVTSERDYFREPIAALHAELRAASVPHEHLLLPGPHDYPWNRGPGAIEMLLWHDRVLRGEPPA
jgi:enterochelin esterase-like enzyme